MQAEDVRKDKVFLFLSLVTDRLSSVSYVRKEHPMSDNLYAPLPKAEVIKAVERRNPCRVPQVMAQWWGEGLREQHGDGLAPLTAKYPRDAWLGMIPVMHAKDMGLSWYDSLQQGAGHDANVVISDWSQLDEFIDKMPDPARANIYDYDHGPWYNHEEHLAFGWCLSGLRTLADRAHREDRYLLMGWWNLFYERPWGLRGMENLLMDYYLFPEEVHRLNDALCRLYEGYIDRMARDTAPDGLWTSDDLGNQRQLMMKPEHFREFLLPYYRRVGEACRRNKMHFWLHSCGDNLEILGDLADAGVRVFHPVQKHAMDERRAVREFGDRMTFLAGIDVQHILQEGTPDDVRAEVRAMIDLFDRRDGGMILAAGNGIVGGTPLANIDAFLDEGVVYGWKHRGK